MSFAKTHHLLGHASKEATRKIEKVIEWVLMQATMPPCKSCTIAKAKQKNQCKTITKEKAEKPGECIFFDQSMIRAPEGCKISIINKNWHI